MNVEAGEPGRGDVESSSVVERGLGVLLTVGALNLPKDTTVSSDAPGSTAATTTGAAVTAAAPVTTVETRTTVASTTATTIPTTTAPPTTVPVPGALDALQVLAQIPVANEVQDGYNRDLFQVWDDADHDGCDTRAEVLIRDSTTPVQPTNGCPVTTGQWLSAYDGVVVTDAGQLEVDHVVALKEAWDSGAYAWSPEQRIAFGNNLDDPRTLRAVTVASNQDKADKDPSHWPLLAADQCSYVGDVVAVKARLGLAMDQSEWGRIKNLLSGPCAGWTIAPWSPPVVTTSPTTTVAPTPAPAPPPTSDAGGGLDPRFGTCKEAMANGYGPYFEGTDPEYGWYRDADSDGEVCE